MCTTPEEWNSEAKRLLNNVFNKLRKFPPPTGLPLYKPQPSDIVVATFPKAGTTLMQNMTYQIAVATGGAPAFDPDGTNFTDIGEVSPWIDFGPEFGIMECPSSPRIFKTHSTVDLFDVDKSKFICCIRNPEAYPASWLDFLLDWVSDEEITGLEVREAIFHEFVRRNLLGENPGGMQDRSRPDTSKEGNGSAYGTWFSHVKGWVETPRKNVLVLLYEDVVANYKETAERVAVFMGRNLSEDGLRTVLDRCDRAKMAGDNKFRCQLSASSFGLDENGGMKALPQERRGFKEMRLKESAWQRLRQLMVQTFGVETYAELCKRIRSEQRALGHYL